MSQFGISGQTTTQTSNQVQASNQVEDSKLGPVPPEIKNARVSNSILSKIGHGIKSFFCAIGNFFVNLFKGNSRVDPDPDPGEPRITNTDKTLPDKSPSEDAATLSRNDIYKLNLPNAHKAALNDLLGELREIYGEIAPNSLEVLKKFNCNHVPSVKQFTYGLANKVGDKSVSPNTMKQSAKEVLLTELSRRAIKSAILEHATELGYKFDQEHLDAMATEFHRNNGKRTLNIQEAKDLVQNNLNDINQLLQKHGVLSGIVDLDYLPTEYKNAFNSVVNDLHIKFGPNSCPKNLQDILQLKINKPDRILDIVKDNINKIKSPQDFAAIIRKQLTPVAQQHVVGLAIDSSMKEKGINLHPSILKDYAKTFLDNNPDLKDAVTSNEKIDEIANNTKFINYIKEINSNIESAQDTYLNKVSQDAQPILKGFIFSLPLDKDHLKDSLATLGEYATKMVNWKNKVSYADSNTDKFKPVCTGILDDINSRLSAQTADKYFDGNVFITCETDIPRNNWNINGHKYQKPDKDSVLNDIKNVLKNNVDIKFVTSLANQYLTGTIFKSIIDKDYVNTGLTTIPDNYNHNKNNIIRQSKGSELPPEDRADTYNITIDKKHADIEAVVPTVISTEQAPGYIIGTAMYKIHLRCELQGDSANQPKITNIEISQEFKLDMKATQL